MIRIQHLVTLMLWPLAAGAQVATPSQLQSALNSSNQATVISLFGVDPLSCPQISMTQTFNGGRLIFSDSPESPAARGMLYVDTNLAATPASVPNRIFAYHVNNNSPAQMKFSVLIKNNGAATGTLTVQQAGIAGPSPDYSYVGEVAFNRWLTNPPVGGISVAAGQTVRLDGNFDTLTVPQSYLLNGIWDYTFTQPHTVMICALNTADNPITVGPTLPVLARDIHVRGTFAFCNKTYDTATNVVIRTTAGIQQYPIAGSGDSYVTGFDNAVHPATTETNSGNYGLLYNIQMATSASDGRALGFLINPRAGAWCGSVSAQAGLLPGGQFLIPAGGGTFSDGTEATIEGEYSPGSSGATVVLQFMPTGGVSFPVRMLAVPFTVVGPTLAAISNYVVNAGQTVSFTATATEANTNKPLTFSMPGGPSGAAIGPGNGVFQWRPPVSSAGTSNNIQIRVSDNSLPPLTSTRSFAIAVNPLTAVTLTPLAKTADQLQLRIAGPIGPDYILQGNLTITNHGGWTNLSSTTPATTPFNMMDTNVAGRSNRYYRILLGP